MPGHLTPQGKPLYEALYEALYETVSAALESLSLAPPSPLIQEGVIAGDLEPAQSQTNLDATTHHIVNALLREAYSNGLPGEARVESQYTRPRSGSTAEHVLTITSRINCVFKCDSERKLAEEVAMLRALKSRADLPERFRNRFPFIYASKTDDSPYAYLMESFDGYTGLEQILFGNCRFPEEGAEADVFRIVTSILDCLFEAYKFSLKRLRKPNIDEIYLKRIRDMLRAVRQDKEFDQILAKESVVNDVPYEKYESYINFLSPTIQDYEPSFTTFVHGDPNPENILVKVDTHTVDVKFIDVKEWGDGDYLFDIAKIIHYLLVTGPAERLGTRVQVNKHFRPDGVVELRYSLPSSAVIDRVVKMVEKRTEQLAEEFGDKMWRQRYALAMASNLLGLPFGRVRTDKRESALILYAEGLRWLKEVCAYGKPNTA